MKFSDVLGLALSAIWAHKLRSVLTLLGMIVGVSAVVIVVSMIQGFNTYVDEKIANIGSKSFSIRRFSIEDFKDTDTIAAAQRRNKLLTMDDYAQLRARATLMDKIGAKAPPTVSQVRHSRDVLKDVTVDGAMANVAEIENVDIAEGRYFNDGENETAARVAFIGADVANKLFAAAPVGQEINIAGMPYRVVGVAVAKGTVFGKQQDNFITVPLKSYIKDIGGSSVRQRGLYFVVSAGSDGQLGDAIEEARQLMRTLRGLHAGEKDSFGLLTPDAIIQTRDRIFGPIFVVAIAIPSIALLVGGIVIMNIMLVSVTERTKEIGLRKAVGALRFDILKQFLVEAIILSGIGGAIGVFMAWMAGLLINQIFFQTRLSIIAVLVAVTVSGAVGVISGILPAWKAAHLDPVQALRSES